MLVYFQLEKSYNILRVRKRNSQMSVQESPVIKKKNVAIAKNAIDNLDQNEISEVFEILIKRLGHSRAHRMFHEALQK